MHSTGPSAIAALWRADDIFKLLPVPGHRSHATAHELTKFPNRILDQELTAAGMKQNVTNQDVTGGPSTVA